MKNVWADLLQGGKLTRERKKQLHWVGPSVFPKMNSALFQKGAKSWDSVVQDVVTITLLVALGT